uniref:Uncharacterized protein n=1 Tax=Magnetococcus massalia (strain MO-1) TaxID=451514 RepID=A0A1S7LFI0_MAGMO|nr:protein of unknown function [Candidatus Magnetococcus massalia]
MSSTAKLEAFEKESGHAAVARKGTFRKSHFIRSGKVGEGNEFFTDKQKNFIEHHLVEEGVSLDGSLLE